LADVARPCRHAVGDRWQVDETYLRVAGQWRYGYRAIDQFGQVIDVFVSERRDGAAARRFFESALGGAALALEAARHGLSLSFAEGRAERAVDEWQAIVAEYGYAYQTSGPAELLTSVLTDLIGI
jgi:transposase InsO family protein